MEKTTVCLFGETLVDIYNMELIVSAETIVDSPKPKKKNLFFQLLRLPNTNPTQTPSQLFEVQKVVHRRDIPTLEGKLVVYQDNATEGLSSNFSLQSPPHPARIYGVR